MRYPAIHLSVEGGIWMARHEDPQVRALFGTDSLPTPFTFPGLPMMEVSFQIARLNPGRKITITAPDSGATFVITPKGGRS